MFLTPVMQSSIQYQFSDDQRQGFFPLGVSNVVHQELGNSI